MHWLQILGWILLLIGTGLSFWGSIIQWKENQVLQDKQSKFIIQQEKINNAKIEINNIKKISGNLFSLELKNIWDNPASEVELIFTNKGFPKYFSSNPITVIDEIPRLTEKEIKFDIFAWINLLLSLPNNDDNKKIKDELKNIFKEFNEWNKVFIAVFYIKYKSNWEEKKTDEYYLSISKNNQFNSFWKY